MNDDERQKLKERTAIDRVVNGPDMRHRAAEILIGEMTVYLRSGQRALRCGGEDGKMEVMIKHTIDIARLDSPVYKHRTGQFCDLVKQIVSINRSSSHLFVENVFNSGLERHLKNNGWRVSFAAGDDFCRSYFISVAEAKQRYCVQAPVHAPRSPLVLDIAEDDLDSVRTMVNRALNTLEPHHWPDWLRKFDADIDHALSRRAEAKSVAEKAAMGESPQS